MKGDFSRSTFNPKKHYTGVRMQQGRVQLDADWNEQVDITHHRIQTETGDVVGLSGAHVKTAGFHIAINNGEIRIGKGRYYVGGLSCENEEDVSLTSQRELPDYKLPSDSGLYLAYLDVWQHHITALEELELREVALGGADTATRTKSVWQVKLLKVGELGDTLDYSQFEPGWKPPGAGSSGKLRARMRPGAISEVENQLYRVEIHKGGGPGTATFKWSRNNGIVVAGVESISGDRITITSTTGSPQAGFAPGQWVEVSDEGRVLRGEPGLLVQLDEVQGRYLKVLAWPGGGAPSLGRNATVRLWDQEGAEGDLREGAIPLTTGGYLDLGEGVQVEFSNGEYRTGDYWLIPVRTILREVLWPVDAGGDPLFESCLGVYHHYGALGVLEFDSGVNQWTPMKDCRKLFWTAPELTSGKVSRAGDTMTGPLTIQETLTVEKNITAEKDLTVLGNLEVRGDMLVHEGEKFVGEVQLGDQDEDIVIIRGKIRSAHSSGELQVDDAMHVEGPLTVETKIGVGRAPLANVDVNGDIRLQSGVAVNEISDDATLSDNSDSAVPTERAVKEYVDNLLAGSIAAFAMETPPEGWLECNGQMVSRTEYRRLYDKIRITFGNGKGDDNTFNVPDLRGEFIRGWDHGRGVDPGRGFGTFQWDQIQSHRHSDYGHGHGDAGHGHPDPGHAHPYYHGNFSAPGGAGAEVSIHSGYGDWHNDYGAYANLQTGYANLQTGYANLSNPVDSRHGQETRPRNVALMYCIKF